MSALYVRPSDNKLYIGGSFSSTVGTKVMKGIMSYDGVNFDSLGTGIDLSSGVQVHPQDLIEYQGDLYIGGQFGRMGTINTVGIAKWNGIKWDSLNEQLNGYVNGLRVYNNELYAVGLFWKAGNIDVRSVAKYNGANWSNVGPVGFPYTTYTGYPFINCVEVYNNELYVGGDFYDSTTTHICCAKFDGTSWKKAGLVIFGGVTEVLDMEVYNGNLYLAGRFKEADGNIGNAILKYNGQTWSKVGEAITDPGTCEITRMNVINNKLWIVGGFKSIENTLAAGSIAIWNDTCWCVPPTGPQSYKCSSVASFQNKIFMGGAFSVIGTDTVGNLAVLNTTVTTCSAPVGIKENSPANSLLTPYPNPATNNLNIDLSQFRDAVKVSIYSASGQEVLSSYVSPGLITFSVKDLKPGIYAIRVAGRDKAYTGKFIKE